MEAYIDDMAFKSIEVSKQLVDLDEIFTILRKFRLCLNASKCFFGVGSGKFLGYMVTHREIKVDPEQIRAIYNLHPLYKPQRGALSNWNDS